MVKYPKAFFDLNLRFAHRVAEVSQQALANVLLHYTYLYLSFGLGRSFNIAHPLWQTYLVGLEQRNDLGEWTYTFYQRQQAQATPQVPEPGFGCFYYTLWPNQRIRIHFFNRDVTAIGPLHRTRQHLRCAELTVLFTHIKQQVDQPTTVVGGSWLYNLDAYRRLFPPPYLATARPRENDFQFITLWGQFLDHQRRIKQELATQFLTCLQQPITLDRVQHCFPFPVLSLECPIAEFYNFYKIC